MQKNNKNGVKITAVITIVVLMALIVVFGLLASRAFRKDDAVINGMELYFLETETATLKAETRSVKGNNDYEILANTLNELKAGPKTEGYVNAVPQEVSFLSIQLDESIATVDVSQDYLDMKAGQELLCRAAVVWTLNGIEFVDGVKITVDGKELCKANGDPIGVMKREDIVIDAEISPEPTNYETVKLYFSNKDATGLAVEEREIEVNPNQPLEKYVMEQLIAGPQTPDLYATIPAETKIRDIKTVDGICYVDLSNEFVSKHNGGSTGEILTVYSIVNSLTELDYINRVQFLIEGKKVEEFKGHLDFSKPFEAMDVDI